jgi:hypothetical protein
MSWAIPRGLNHGHRGRFHCGLGTTRQLAQARWAFRVPLPIPKGRATAFIGALEIIGKRPQVSPHGRAPLRTCTELVQLIYAVLKGLETLAGPLVFAAPLIEKGMIIIHWTYPTSVHAKITTPRKTRLALQRHGEIAESTGHIFGVRS